MACFLLASRLTIVSLDILKYLEWLTLEQRHKELKILMLFKIMNHFVEVPSEELLIPSSCAYTRGHNKKIRQLPTRLKSFQNSFFSIKLWNRLLNHLVNVLM